VARADRPARRVSTSEEEPGRVAVTDEAINKIKNMIVSGELGPGDRLPREKELSERLGLSRNSLREAVKALSLIRILDVRQGDGTYVTSLAPPLLLEALSFVVDLHADSTVLELLEVRRILEPAAAAMACARADGATVRRLRSLLDEVSEDVPVEALVANDLELHRCIAESSGNAYLAGLIDSLSGRTARARIWRGVTESQAASRTLAEHRAIVEAIAAGQPDLARSWATVHVSGVETWLRRLL
jgi:GntR family transcriptional regulator, transcriptional repressor for pyruvate dehydrogenase complex